MRREWTFAILWGILIFTLSSLPSLPGTDRMLFGLPSDKWLHFCEFGFFGFLVARGAMKSWARWHRAKKITVAFSICFLWAVADEVHQGFVPGRSKDMLDLLADTGGIIFAQILTFNLSALRNMLRRKKIVSYKPEDTHLR